jgi:hypothetical protein
MPLAPVAGAPEPRPSRLRPNAAQSGPSYPSVSLLLPLDGGPWSERLHALARTAAIRLRNEFSSALDPDLVHHLRDTVAHAAPAPGARSLAVFVDAAGGHVESLPVDVRERVVIDDTFATRDLVESDLRTPTYWVLALELTRPRLLRGRGQDLRHQPLAVDRPPARPHGDRYAHGRERSDLHDADRARRLRAVDAALVEAIGSDDDPLVVVGAEPTLSRFLRVTRHPARIAAPLRRRPDADAAVLARHVWPTVLEVLADRRESALAALDQAVRSRRAVTGIEPLWAEARRCRGALLLVERSFEQPARTTGTSTIELVDDADLPGVIDDAVDEIIEHVLARGGRVEIVPDGVLTAQDRIALVPPRR